MSSSKWGELLVSAQADGPALASSTTATSILQPQAKFPINLALLRDIGQTFMLKAGGRVSSAAATPGTITIGVNIGATNVFTSGASPTIVTSGTNLTWDLELELTVRALGTASNFMGRGRLLSAILSATVPIMLLPASAPAVGSNVDLTAGGNLDLMWTWSFSSASNSVTLHQYELWLCN